MDNEHDIRWHQRLQHFEMALSQLQEAKELTTQRALSKIETQGLIKAFEFTYELAWNVIKDYFYYQGNTGITGSRDAIREAFKQEIISDGDSWMEMIKSRNKTSHTYNEETANEISHKIVNTYVSLFIEFRNKMKKLMLKSDKIEYGLTQKTLTLIKEVFIKHPQINQVLIYGSRAKGSYRTGSDIDLTLKGDNISLEILLKIENELDELMLPYKFDVSIYDKITDCDVLEHINRESKVLF